MGQESLEKLSIQKYLVRWEKGLREEYDKQYLQDHFKIGDGADKNKISFYSLYLETFCTDNCELSEWIWKKINGFFEEPSINRNNEVESLRYQPVQNITNIYNSHQNWQEVQW